MISTDPVAGTFELLAAAAAAPFPAIPAFPVNLVVSSGLPPGTPPPPVAIATPAAGANLTGTVNVTATVTSPMAGVQFLVDGAPIGAEDTTAPFSVSWNTATVANGQHALSALARDASGATFVSFDSSVNVTNDQTPPTVSITSPANGGVVTGSKVTVTATATDNVGVVGVQFLLNGTPIGAEATTAPYTVRWNTNQRGGITGTQVLSARARDAAGNVATSANVTVTVQ
ncbi:MAG TPA: Ig-like domain-containing protein [Mycobacteriales bacterium]|nr:Ig-like domain-containing protein [Mycobacteriales bacterium]